MNKDIRQSENFAYYLSQIGWKIERIQGWNIFFRSFPLIGSLMKIQRVNKTLSLQKIDELAEKYRAFRVILELNTESPACHRLLPKAIVGGGIRNQELGKYGFKVSKNPHAPSKTIQVDLTPSEKQIFMQFEEAKRRGVRRAIKHRIIVKESSDIEAFIKLKWGNDPFFFWLVKGNQLKLWQAFAPKNATVLFAYQNNHYDNIYYHSKHSSIPIAGILLLFYDKVAYYWQAAATREGKKLFAPTLLVWEALKLAKKRGCRIFDFEGIYDERFPSKTSEKWKGFTKFKQGFGGKEKYYPPPWFRSKF